MTQPQHRQEQNSVLNEVNMDEESASSSATPSRKAAKATSSASSSRKATSANESAKSSRKAAKANATATPSQKAAKGSVSATSSRKSARVSAAGTSSQKAKTTTASSSATPSRRSKRSHPKGGDKVPSKKVKKQEKEPPKVDNSGDDESDEDGNPATSYARRIIMRNKMYKSVDEIEIAQRRMEHGDEDDVAIHKAVKRYEHAEILKEEYKALVNGRDLSIDSVLGDRLSRVLLIKAGKISSGSDKFKFGEFAENVKERGAFRELYRQDLNGLLDTCVAFKSLAIVDFGAPPKPKKPRAERAPRKNTVKGELVDVKGKQTNELDEEKDSDFTRQLDHVIKAFRSVLKERKLNRVNYYEFIIDPQDFGSTIQNSFCVAFLLKDMKLYLEKKEDDEFPYLRKLSKDEKAAADAVVEGGKPLPTNQTINTVTYAKWQGITEELNLTEALIKPIE